VTPATGKTPTKRAMTLTRDLDAPRDLVWKVYTQPEHIVHWMAAADWTTPSADVDARRGGGFKVEMRALDGAEGFIFQGVYDEVVEPELLVLEIADGRIMRTTLEDLGGGRTRLTLSWEMALGEADERQGYTEILNKLTQYLKDRLPAKPEIIITRVFDAPRDVLFKAFTDPERLREWFGPKGFTVPAFRLGMKMADGDGKVYWVTGAYREVVAPERIVMTMSGEGDQGDAPDTQVTVTFLERGGRTLVILHQTGMPRQAISGASEGWTQSLDKLAAALSKR
jgi:uncharacterized protein YndB with AHSA1/START domain